MELSGPNSEKLSSFESLKRKLYTHTHNHPHPTPIKHVIMEKELITTYLTEDLVKSLWFVFEGQNFAFFGTLDDLFLKKWSVTFSLYWHEPSQRVVC